MKDLGKTRAIMAENLLRVPFKIRFAFLIAVWVACEFLNIFSLSHGGIQVTGLSLRIWPVRILLFLGVILPAAFYWSQGRGPHRIRSPERVLILFDILLISLMGHYLGLTLSLMDGLAYALLFSWAAAVLKPREMIEVAVFCLLIYAAVFFLEIAGLLEALYGFPAGVPGSYGWLKFFMNLGVILFVSTLSLAVCRAYEKGRNLIQLGTYIKSISHQIKTPLSTILRAVELLRLDHQRWELDVIHEHTKRIDRIVNDLINYETNTRTEMEKVEVRDIVNGSIESVLAGLQGTHGIRIKKNYPQDRVFVKGDAEWLRQSFTNIIKNAVEAVNDSGSVKVEIRANRMFHVDVTIRDEGTGMPREVREKVFEPFFTTKPGGRGVGLGLPIAKKIIEGHQGKIFLESEPQCGTTFTVILPTLQDAMERIKGIKRPSVQQEI